MKLMLNRGVILILMLALTGFIINRIMAPEPVVERERDAQINRKAFVKPVKNQALIATVDAYGQVQATETVPVMIAASGPITDASVNFQPGYRFKTGDLLLKLDDTELVLQIKAAKSEFMTQLIGLIAEFSLDYPDRVPVWQAYLKTVSLDAPLPDLPDNRDTLTDYRLASLGIFTQYFTIKQQEDILGDFAVYAPFDGIVKTSSIRPGSFVSAGQVVGSIIDPTQVHVDSIINLEDSDYIQVNTPVQVQDIQNASIRWPGVIQSINASVSEATQGVPVRIRIQANQYGLPQDGRYIRVHVPTQPIPDVTRVNRSLLDNNRVYGVEDGKLVYYPVTVILSEAETVLVRGLAPGSVILTQPVPGAYVGLDVDPV